MAFSKQEFIQRVKQQYPQYQNMNDDELFNAVIKKYPQYSNQISMDDDAGIVNVGQGVAMSAGATGLGIGQLGRNVQRGISKVGESVFGKYNPFKMGEEGIFDVGSSQNTRARELVTPDTRGEKFGKFVGDVAQFTIPGSMATKATTGMSLGTRMLAQGAVSSGVQAAQTGDIGKDEAVAGVTSALMVPAFDVLSKGFTSLSKHFPEWLVRPLLKQAPGAKLQGKDAAKYLVESGKIGTVDSLIRQSDDAMRGLNTQIDDLIAQGVGKGVTVSRKDIVGQIVNQINDAGGAIDETQLLSTIDTLAPQARGLLSKEVLTIKEANQLRKLLDSTLGDKAFIAKELTFNKQILMDFTNALREGVKRGFDNADEAVAGQIGRQVTSAKQVLDSLPEEKIAQNGGVQALIKRAQTNIVDALRSMGKGKEADKIAKIATTGMESLDDFSDAAFRTVNPVRPLYEEYAKNITVKNALMSRATAGGGANSIGMYDLLTGGAAFTATGNPVVALLAAGGRRALETAPVKTLLAQIFRNSDKVGDALIKASPATRGILLEFISLLSEDESPNQATKTQSQPTSGLR